MWGPGGAWAAWSQLAASGATARAQPQPQMAGRQGQASTAAVAEGKGSRGEGEGQGKGRRQDDQIALAHASYSSFISVSTSMFLAAATSATGRQAGWNKRKASASGKEQSGAVDKVMIVEGAGGGAQSGRSGMGSRDVLHFLGIAVGWL